MNDELKDLLCDTINDPRRYKDQRLAVNRNASIRAVFAERVQELLIDPAVEQPSIVERIPEGVTRVIVEDLHGNLVSVSSTTMPSGDFFVRIDDNVVCSADAKTIDTLCRVLRAFIKT